ncbi:hypothetical protein ACOTR2_00615 (plasmid) [Enterobacter asburiae]
MLNRSDFWLMLRCSCAWLLFLHDMQRATSLAGTGAVMLRTEPAALSLPGPSGAAGFHPSVATSTAGLLRPFRSRRLSRAVACAFCTPAY